MEKSGNRDDFDKSQRDLKRLITSKPYPTGGNLENQKLNLEGLQNALSDHKGKLLAEGVLDLIPSATPDYELAVKERIKNGYIKSMRDAAIANRVKIKSGEAFGFSDYLERLLPQTTIFLVKHWINSEPFWTTLSGSCWTLPAQTLVILQS